MSIADKLVTIAENEQKVYDAGNEAAMLERDELDTQYLDNINLSIESYTDKAESLSDVPEKIHDIAFSEYDTGYADAEGEIDSNWWDRIQDSGRRTIYEYAFSRWGYATITPKYKIAPTTNASFRNFAYYSSITKIGDENKTYFDLSALSGTNNMNAMFSMCRQLQTVYDLGLTGDGSYTSMFYGCSSLRRIEVLRCTANTTFASTFTNCSALVTVIFEGVIGSSINLQWSTKLDHESLLSIINCLEDKTGDTSTTVCQVTIGSSNLAKLTTEEIETAKAKGWNIV